MPRLSCKRTERRFVNIENEMMLDKSAQSALRYDRRLQPAERRRLYKAFGKRIRAAEKRLRAMSKTLSRCRREGRI